MKWDEMTAEQRDALVSEKVMGVSAMCNGTLKIRTVRNAYDFDPEPLRPTDLVEWQCVTCGAMGGCTYENIPNEHSRLIPRYSTDLNAAWKIVEHITQPPQKSLGLRSPNILFIQWWQRADLWAMSREEATEMICKAALKAYGIDIKE